MEDARRPPRRSDDISIFTHNTTQTPGTLADGGGAVDILHGGPAAGVESPSTRPPTSVGHWGQGPPNSVCIVLFTGVSSRALCTQPPYGPAVGRKGGRNTQVDTGQYGGTLSGMGISALLRHTSDMYVFRGSFCSVKACPGGLFFFSVFRGCAVICTY